MSDANDVYRNSICPKCRGLTTLRLRRSLPEVDGLPQVECLECSGCHEVLLVELGLGERRETVRDHAVRMAA